MLAAALLLLVILPASAQRIVVNVTAKKQTLADILPQISKQTGIEFSYALELVKTRSKETSRTFSAGFSPALASTTGCRVPTGSF